VQFAAAGGALPADGQRHCLNAGRNLVAESPIHYVPHISAVRHSR